MLTKKYQLLGFSIVLLVSISFIPLLNMFFYPQVYLDLNLEKNLSAKIKKIFSTDGLEGIYNKGLAHLGLSGDIGQVVIGKDGFMFLGNIYSRPMDQHMGYVLV